MHRIGKALKNTFKILALGDVVGPRAVEYLSKNLWKIRKNHKIDMVIANGENSAEPNGIDKTSARALFDSGVDVITTGNHVFRKTSVFSYLDDEENILRPLNFPSECPGHGDTIIKINGYKILVLNVSPDIFYILNSTYNPYNLPLDNHKIIVHLHRQLI